MWICPTFGRPERLKELARSWKRCQPQTKLFVRLYEKDPEYLGYKTLEWPKNWEFYTSSAEYCADALNEFFQMHPEEPFYGFIADDIVLRTPGGLELLQSLAIPFFVAYPNDCLQRWRLATHFCVGGDLLRELGWWCPPGLRHHHIDVVLHNLALNCGLLRYEPRVIFHHKHFLSGQAPWDPTYARIYTTQSSQAPDSELDREDSAVYKAYAEGQMAQDVKKIRRELFIATEDWDAWKEQDEAEGGIVLRPS